QTNSADTTVDVVDTFDADGHGDGQVTSNAMTNRSAPYEYRGTDLASDLDSADVKIGHAVNGIMLTSLSIDLEQGQPAKLTLEGHEHADNDHANSATPGDFDGYDMDFATILGTQTDEDIAADCGID